MTYHKCPYAYVKKTTYNFCFIFILESISGNHRHHFSQKIISADGGKNYNEVSNDLVCFRYLYERRNCRVVTTIIQTGKMILIRRS